MHSLVKCKKSCAEAVLAAVQLRAEKGPSNPITKRYTQRLCSHSPSCRTRSPHSSGPWGNRYPPSPTAPCCITGQNDKNQTLLTSNIKDWRHARQPLPPPPPDTVQCLRWAMSLSRALPPSKLRSSTSLQIVHTYTPRSSGAFTGPGE